MSKKTLLFALLFIANLATAQEKFEFVDSESIIQELANELQGEGEIDNQKMLDICKKINPNDTAYYGLLASQSYYLLQMDKYDEVIELINDTVLKESGNSRHDFFLNKTVAYLSSDKLEQAMDFVKLGQKSFPYSPKMMYNKGLIHEKLKNIPKAVECYQKALMFDPLMKSAHLKLGNICYKQEKISQALMCYDLYLLLEPDGASSLNALSYINNLVSSKNPNTADPNIEISIDDEAFEGMDGVLSNRIALNDKYKIDCKINVPVIKQNHAMMEQLGDYDGNDGFWSKKYVPFYKWIYENDNFNNFAYTLSYSIETEKYAKIIRKNDSDIIDFYNLMKSKWIEIMSKNTVIVEGKEKKLFFYYDNYLIGVGSMKNKEMYGMWSLLGQKGELNAKGEFDKTKKTGEWNWYYPDGILKEHGNYKNNKPDGEYSMYHANGRIQEKSIFKNGKITGNFKFYNEHGALEEEKYFKNGTLEGKYLSYFPVGKDLKEYDVDYKNGKPIGVLKEYHENGKLYRESPFKDENIHGVTKYYYPNGNLQAKKEFKSGVQDGDFITYFMNGNIDTKGKYINEEPDGEWEKYYQDKTIRESYSFSNGKRTGVSKEYDYDGKIVSEFKYRRGNIVAYKFFDKKGGIVHEDKKKSGEFYYKGYSPYQILITEGLYDVKGGKSGIWKYYSNNGVKNAQCSFTDNKLDGEYTRYYNNSQIESVYNYDNDTIKGYYIRYHKNGKIKEHGYYKDGLKQSEWLTYFTNGKLESKLFYHKDKYQGKQFYYKSTGELDAELNYNKDFLITKTNYKKDGTIYSKVNFKLEPGNQPINEKHINGSISSSSNYSNSVQHGEYNYTNVYGIVSSKGTYLNGNTHGEWINKYPSGSIKLKANYLLGELDGKILEYYENGNKSAEGTYILGNKEGKYISYYEDYKGNTEFTANYVNGNQNGTRTDKSATGEVQLYRYYDHGRLIGYSYNDESGNKKEMIPIIKETGKIIGKFPNGKKSRVMEYKNGDLINVYTAYYTNGNKENEIHFTDGDYDGTFTSYYQNGQIKEEFNYFMGTLDGPYKKYYSNGNIMKSSNYNQGYLDGVVEHYNESGKLINKEIYDYGEIVSYKKY